MRQIEIVDAPDGGIVGRGAALALAEEDQFEAEAAAVACDQIPSVVPPLGAEVGVARVVAGELEAVARKGQPEVGGRQQ
jgi:hypothetical protein